MDFLRQRFVFHNLTWFSTRRGPIALWWPQNFEHPLILLQEVLQLHYTSWTESFSFGFFETDTCYLYGGKQNKTLLSISIYLLHAVHGFTNFCHVTLPSFPSRQGSLSLFRYYLHWSHSKIQLSFLTIFRFFSSSTIISLLKTELILSQKV